MNKNKRCAQSMIEYALLVAVAVGALLGMYNYLSRSLQGRLRSASDSLPGKLTPGGLSDIEVAGTVTGRSTVTRNKSEFSYEGGQYEGAVFVRHIKKNENTHLRLEGQEACDAKDIEDGVCDGKNK